MKDLKEEDQGIRDGRTEARQIARLWRVLFGNDDSQLPMDEVNMALGCRRFELSATRGDTYADAFIDAYRVCLSECGIVQWAELFKHKERMRLNVN